MPTKMTDTPKPLRKRPKIEDMATSKSSAIFERSNTTPMNTNKGTAIKVVLLTIPNKREGAVSK